MIDELIPQIEQAQAEGAIVLVKWDGGRTRHRCTVVVTRADTDFVWRMDGDDVGLALKAALADYRAKHDQ